VKIERCFKITEAAELDAAHAAYFDIPNLAHFASAHRGRTRRGFDFHRFCPRMHVIGEALRLEMSCARGKFVFFELGVIFVRVRGEGSFHRIMLIVSRSE